MMKLTNYYGAGPGIGAFLLTMALGSAVQLKTSPPGYLLERYFPGAGWIEVVALAVYAGAVAGVMSDPSRSARWRARIWGLFSAVFFVQLFIGLMGVEKFLMTGKLHLPVPALIVAGPVYRGHGLFMLVLFLVTIALVGPAWCSHLCYIGAWDHAAAGMGGKPTPLPFWRKRLRLVFLAVVIAAALGLRYAGVPSYHAAIPAAAFGVVGVVIMAWWSRRTGAMTHCTAYCPIGWVACRLGKINPFRVRIGDGCTACGNCAQACRYDALNPADIESRRPGESCTLCGDCVGRCPDGNIGYGFPGLSPRGARAMFILLAVSLHAIFLGVARI